MDFQQLFKSKRFWATVASIAVIAFKDKLPLTEEQIQQLVYAIGAWVVGESVRPVAAKMLGAR